jgi:alkylation response protein AidB-like acyl-CoA dehydrogenase
MRFSFDPDQRQFAQALRELLERECTPKDLRAVAQGEDGRSADRWRALAEMGVVGLTAPVDHGGLGLDEVGLVLLMEEAGRAALPEPLLETAVAIALLRDVAGDDVRERWLRPVATGELMIAVGLRGLPVVAHAGFVDGLLLEDEGSLHLLPGDSVTLTSRPSVDPTRPLATVKWQPTKASLIAEGETARGAATAAFDRGALGAAAQLLGLAARMIEMAAAYANERVQFGKPIGTFQAVKHHLANALVRLEFARPVVYQAAWSVANDVPDRSRDVSMAKASASEAALVAARGSLQVHGAIGYTEEHDLHLWLKRTRALASAWGTPAWHRRRVAEAVLGQPPEG